MRYRFEKPTFYTSQYGITYKCNHLIYNRCTLYLIGDKGLAVIQQRFDPEAKITWWGEIDPWLTDLIYLHPKFKEVFDKHSGTCVNGIYPTITVRQLMWALKMKPLPKEKWETVFDRKDI